MADLFKSKISQHRIAENFASSCFTSERLGKRESLEHINYKNAIPILAVRCEKH